MSTTRDDLLAVLDARRAAIAREAEAAHVKADLLAQLLRGGMTLLGKRVELRWPDGPPAEMTEEDILRFLDRSAGRDA